MPTKILCCGELYLNPFQTEFPFDIPSRFSDVSMGYSVGNKANGRISKRTCVSGGKKCSFFVKLGVLCFLVTPILRFAFLPYRRR